MVIQMRTEWITPWEVATFTKEIEKQEISSRTPSGIKFSHSGAWANEERSWVQFFLANYPLVPSVNPLANFLDKKLGIPSQDEFEMQLITFQNLLPPGAHLTADERIDALARKLMSVAADCGKKHAHTIGGNVPEELLVWFEQELHEGIFRSHADRIIRGMRDYGFAPEFPKVPPFVSGTPEYTGACAGWWQEVFASYRKFGTEWEKHRLAQPLGPAEDRSGAGHGD